MLPTVSLLVIVLLVLLVGVGIFLAGQYNRLVALRNQAEEAWAGIDVQLTRRHDLIPNLVETVRGYADHEQETFAAVTQARTSAVSASGPAGQAEAEGLLTQALGRLFALAEDYPELQADENFRALQDELADTEDQIAESRRVYNAAVRDYDTAREVFPTVIVANLFGFEEREYFEIDDPEARDPVRVEF